MEKVAFQLILNELSKLGAVSNIETFIPQKGDLINILKDAGENQFILQIRRDNQYETIARSVFISYWRDQLSFGTMPSLYKSEHINSTCRFKLLYANLTVVLDMPIKAIERDLDKTEKYCRIIW